MGLYQKIQLYKTLLTVFWCVNVILICATLLAAFRFFQNNRIFEGALQNQKEILSMLSFDNEFAAISALPTKTDDQVYEYRKRTDNLKKDLLAHGNLPSEIKDFAESPKWRLSPTEWSTLRTSLLSRVKANIKGNEESFSNVGRTTLDLLFLGIATLVFGIVLPLFIFALLTKNLLKAKKGFEEKLSKWMARILEKIPTDKNSPWSNPIFWIEVVLAGFEIFAPQSKHPIVLVLRDFIPTVRNEFAKVKAESSHGNS